MLNVSIQIIFTTGRILAEGCSGSFLLEPPSIGAVDLDCVTISTISGSNAPSGGDVSVRVDNIAFEGCSVPYISGHNASGVLLNIECPGKKLVLLPAPKL